VTLPNEVPTNTIIVEGVAGFWQIVPYNMPVERGFERRDDAVKRAKELAATRVPAMTVTVLPPPGPFYK
jgi:hypothetical protein